ncbi:MAG: tetratricopeptide repeat protein [Candidatus Eremiobacterota bacterium]
MRRRWVDIAILVVLVAVLAAWLRDDPEAHLRRAREHMQAGRYGPAAEEYTRVIQLQPGRTVAYSERAVAWQHRGRYEEAHQDHQRALELGDTSAANRNGLAWSLCMLHRYAEALPHAEEACRLEPGTAEYLDTRGVAHLGLGNLEDAQRDIEQAYDLAPLSFRYQAHLMQVVTRSLTAP